MKPAIMGPFKRPVSNHYLLELFLLTLLICLWLIATSRTDPYESHTTSHAHITPAIASSDEPEAVKTPITGQKGYQMDVTGFSSVECGTQWCQAHAGEPRGQRVALNAKYGRVSRVYVPAFDKEYAVIGTTDENTSLDIWFGDDQQAARELGRKNLLVYLIE